MAHFAQLDNSNVVVTVIKVANDALLDDNNLEKEELGIAFCKNLFGEETRWVQTFYSNSKRKHFAGIGFIYNSRADIFIEAMPQKGMVLNEETLNWEYPTQPPLDGFLYNWDQEDESWIPIQKPFPSWSADYELGIYVAPSSRPEETETVEYYWDEDTVSWLSIDKELP